MSTPVGPIAQAISDGFKLLKTVLDTAEVRSMRKAIEAGEKYIQVNEKVGEFDYLNDEQQKRHLLKYRKRFFKYN